MTDIIFACPDCKEKEVQRCKEELKDVNAGKKFLGKKNIKDIWKLENFMRVASKAEFMKGTEFDYGYDGTDCWIFHCSVCEGKIRFDRGLGSL